jgi:TolA-binding protein
MGILLSRQSDTNDTRAAYQQAIDLGHPNAAPRAKVNLGNLLTGQGDAASAKAAYQRHRLGHPDAAPHGALRLGMFLADHGTTEQARTAYQQALSPGSSAVRQEAG